MTLISHPGTHLPTPSCVTCARYIKTQCSAARLSGLAPENGALRERKRERRGMTVGLSENQTCSMNQVVVGGKGWRGERGVIDGVKTYDGVSVKRGRKTTWLSWITAAGNEVVTLSDMPITIASGSNAGL